MHLSTTSSCGKAASRLDPLSAISHFFKSQANVNIFKNFLTKTAYMREPLPAHLFKVSLHRRVDGSIAQEGRPIVGLPRAQRVPSEPAAVPKHRHPTLSEFLPNNTFKFHQNLKYSPFSPSFLLRVYFF